MQKGRHADNHLVEALPDQEWPEYLGKAGQTFPYEWVSTPSLGSNGMLQQALYRGLGWYGYQVTDRERGESRDSYMFGRTAEGAIRGNSHPSSDRRDRASAGGKG
jgi:hypothetical protein